MHKKVGIIGSGMVGQALAKGFLKYGSEVLIGTSHPEKYDELKSVIGGDVRTGSFADAANFGDLIVLAVRGTSAEELVKSSDFQGAYGKIVLDTSNPIAKGPPVNGVIQYFTDFNESLMEKLQKAAPDVRFVKCFNSVGAAHMVDPAFPDGKPTMFICGNSEEAKRGTTEILTQFGWETADMGSMEAARAIEPLAMLWCIPGFRENNWNNAFKFLSQ